MNNEVFYLKKGGKGGANTNRGGLEFEKETDLAAFIQRDLSDKYTLLPYEFKEPVIKSSSTAYQIYRNDNLETPIGLITKQFQFYNGLWDLYHLKNINHKQWKPDEVFFNLETNTVYIVEKKWQETAGSVDEKSLALLISAAYIKTTLIRRLMNQNPRWNSPLYLIHPGGFMELKMQPTKGLRTLLLIPERMKWLTKITLTT